MRTHLPNRRLCEHFSFEHNGLRYTATISRFANGDLSEIFLNSDKNGSHSDSLARDSAVICSIALQYSVPLEVIRHALLRDGRGEASSPLGVALDLFVTTAGAIAEQWTVALDAAIQSLAPRL